MRGPRARKSADQPARRLPKAQAPGAIVLGPGEINLSMKRWRFSLLPFERDDRNLARVDSLSRSECHPVALTPRVAFSDRGGIKPNRLFRRLDKHRKVQIEIDAFLHSNNVWILSKVRSIGLPVPPGPEFFPSRGSAFNSAPGSVAAPISPLRPNASFRTPRASRRYPSGRR